jgi:nucleotide-binding universal stress UspA family protein
VVTSTFTRASKSSATQFAQFASIGFEPRLGLLPKNIGSPRVVHDGTSEAEVLGGWWATHFGGSVATLEAPAPAARCTGLDADWVARISDWVARIKGVGADLVVVARDARGGLRDPAGLSEYLLEQLDVPVLACGAACPQLLRTILAPVDGTRHGLDALPTVLALARAVRAQVILLQVVELPTTWPNGFADPDPELQAFGRARDQLEQLKLAFQLCGVSTQAVVHPGPVVASVAAVAKRSDVDLLAMSTHARTGTARSVHGSIAGAIARRVPQPILWVHKS